MKKAIITAALLLTLGIPSVKGQDVYDVPITSIRCSDPFILADKADNTYYMYSTGNGGRVMSRASKDLINWTQPYVVRQFTDEHWAGARAASWAAEVHQYKGKYYLFTTSFTDETIAPKEPGHTPAPHRATQIYVSDSPRGPFVDFTNNTQHTPMDWAALDGTLWVEDGIPYMVFCREWVQVVDGTMELVELPQDLGVPTEKPVTLFKASDAKWNGIVNPDGTRPPHQSLITDGPFVFRTQTGKLGMIWSGWSAEHVYTTGVAYSESGSIKGPWVQDDTPIFTEEGGHGMIFRTFDGDLKLCMHITDPSDERPSRRPVIWDLDDSGDKIVLHSEIKPQVINFKPGEDFSGGRIPVKAFDKNFPTDWTPYNYLVLVLKATSSEYMRIGINTENGYAENKVTFFATDGWIRTVVPLEFFSKKPEAKLDLAATYNKKRPFAHYNLSSKLLELKGVDAIGITMASPVKESRVEIAQAYLTVGDPGDKYLGAIDLCKENGEWNVTKFGSTPVVDEFGQWNIGDYPGKIHSEAELKAEWAREDAELASFKDTEHSKYGGFLRKKTKATGYFYVKKIKGRWWFVDPEGYLFLSNGATCIDAAGGGTIANPLKGMYVDNPPEGFVEPEIPARMAARPAQDAARPGRAPAKPHIIWLTEWNKFRRFGPGYKDEQVYQLTINRIKSWGMNTIGNWSSQKLQAMDQLPFTTTLNNIGISSGIFGMPDVYAEGFKDVVAEGVKATTALYKDSRMLIGYFVGNEPTWANNELKLCEYVLEAADDVPMKKALQKYLAENGDTDETRKAFAFKTFGLFLDAVDEALEKYDPNHMNLGIRFGSGLPSKEILQLCKEHFDIYSFNNYAILPSVRTMNAVSEATGLPMIIGEYHFGTVERALGESLIKFANAEERGAAYRNYTEHAFAHPGLIGVTWFQWCDEPILGRGDGENYNTGLVDATDRPYPEMVEAIRATSKCLFDVHSGKAKPFDKALGNPVSTIMDLSQD